MSKDPEDKDQTETSHSEESQNPTQGTSNKTAENTGVDSGSSSTSVSEDLLKDIVGLCRKQNDTILELKQQLAEQKSALEGLTKDVDSQKIHEVVGTVKGKYDFAPSREKFNQTVKENNDEEAYAKTLYDAIKSNNRMF